MTFDLDIVPDPSAANVERPARVLADLDATIRELGDRRLDVSRQLLAASVRGG